MAKLNGLQRIGIIASVVWILGAGVGTYFSEFNRASRFIASAHVLCDASLSGETGDARDKGFKECNKRTDDALAVADSSARLEAALIAFIPVPLCWGGAYIALLLVRWVKRGFMLAS
jgi:hypothetical protein